MMQAVLPGMRDRQGGVIVNVSSSTTIKPLPLLSIYRASKAAINALTESAALELAQFGIRARVVVPGSAPGTSFGSSAQEQIAAQWWVSRGLCRVRPKDDGSDAAARRERPGHHGS